jgi:tetratricopeptide (TPR) repeat protein
MRRAISIIVLLLVSCFCFALSIQQSLDRWALGKPQKRGFMDLILGDSRKLLGDYLFTKADIYFHSGYYLSSFEKGPKESSSHMANEMQGEDHEEEHQKAPGGPRDIIEAFGKKFYPSVHTHLDEKGPGKSGQQVEEILPWLKMSADLDPNRIETYTVAAYWLSQRLHQPRQAELFLREGLRANPGNPSILFELSRIAIENDKDMARGRNLLELALKRWNEQEKPKQEPNTFLLEEIYARLAKVEETTGNYAQAIHYLKPLKELSPHPEMIERQIQELLQKKKT